MKIWFEAFAFKSNLYRYSSGAAAARAATAAGGGSGVSSTGYANGHVAGAGGGGFNTGPQTHRPQTAGTAATMTRRFSYTTGGAVHVKSSCPTA